MGGPPITGEIEIPIGEGTPDGAPRASRPDLQVLEIDLSPAAPMEDEVVSPSIVVGTLSVEPHPARAAPKEVAAVPVRDEAPVVRGVEVPAVVPDFRATVVVGPPSVALPGGKPADAAHAAVAPAVVAPAVVAPAVVAPAVVAPAVVAPAVVAPAVVAPAVVALAVVAPAVVAPAVVAPAVVAPAVVAPAVVAPAVARAAVATETVAPAVVAAPYASSPSSLSALGLDHELDAAEPELAFSLPSRPPAPPPAPARTSLPPGLKPRRADAPTLEAASPPVRPVAPPRPSTTTDLERSFEAFARFDVDAPPVPVAVAPPVARPPPPPAAAFAEASRAGESLLHAVESVAARALAASGHEPEPVDEILESPDDARPDTGGLPRIPLFSDLPEDAFIALFEQCPLRRFEPGQAIIEQGTQGRSFFVICAGSAQVFRVDADGRHDLARLPEGSFFGEMAFLSDAPRSASVEALDEDTQVLEISAELLASLSAQHPSVAAALKKFYRQRLLANLMATAALFRPFTRTERRDLVARFRARDVAPGTVLITEGQPSDGLYLVLAGQVDVVVSGRKVASLGEGQVFGEMSLLVHSPATATVRAARRTSLLRLPHQDFDQLIMSHPQILELVAELTDARRRQNAELPQGGRATASLV